MEPRRQHRTVDRRIRLDERHRNDPSRRRSICNTSPPPEAACSIPVHTCHDWVGSDE